MYVARNTNVGLLAGLVAKGLEERGQATVGGMGAVAISNAYKALLITKVYLKEELEQRDEIIVATPWTETFTLANQEERVRIVLGCHRIVARDFPCRTQVKAREELDDDTAAL